MDYLAAEEANNLQLTACAGTNRRGRIKKVSDPNPFSGEKETEKEKRKEAKEKSKEKNKKGDIAAAISESRAHAGAAEDTRSFKTKNRMIPLAELPKPTQNILQGKYRDKKPEQQPAVPAGISN